MIEEVMKKLLISMCKKKLNKQTLKKIFSELANTSIH